MARVIVSQFITLDGVVEDPGGSDDHEHGGWAFEFERGPEGDEFKLDEIMGSEALLLGRVTYEGFAAAWPSRSGDFADKFNRMQKYVVSTTMDEADWNNTTIIGEDVPESIAALKEKSGGDILVNGSVQLVQTLIDHDLIDEYRLMVFPVVLGAGKSLFGNHDEAATLRLTDTKQVGPDGVLVLTYEPAGRETGG